MDLRFLLLLVCFFVSGFAALLYQTAWSREFAFLFGASELAVVAVLAAYMAGLALGAAAASRLVRRLTRPVLTYGLLELGIALCALSVSLGIRIVQGVYLSIAGGLDAPPENVALTTALLQLVGAFVVLLPCTALMGATLPLLARYAVHEDRQIGPRVGVLYGVNTFGAIAGTLVAAFVLLPELGLRQTVYVGVVGNLLVFLAAAALARGLPGVHAAADGAAGDRGIHWVLPMMAVSGAVSFVYEVLWTRLLGNVLGGSTAAFASMLASFLLGIALGSAAAARLATTRAAAGIGFVVAQLMSGALAFFAFRAADWLPELARTVGASPAAPAPGAAAAGIVLLPLTLCIGATFPFAVRLLARDAEAAAAVSGRVYAWNTMGSIAGAILAGFFLLPGLGLETTAVAGAVTSLTLAFAAAWWVSPRARSLAAVAAVGIGLVVWVRLPLPEELILHSAMTGRRVSGELRFLGVGRSATVTVVERAQGWSLFTNGLPESAVNRASVPDLGFAETAWLSLLATAARPEIDRMQIIGLGGALTLEAVASSVAEIDVIELEEEVVVANRRIPRPRDPLDDARVSLRIGDARGAMMLTDARYGAVVSQPSHPWTSGASHLYTREFFRLVESKLEPGGVFVQWIGASFVDEDLLATLMAALADVFDHVQVHRPVPAAIVFVASDEPLDLVESAPRALAAARDSFGRYGIDRVEDFLASWTLDTAGVQALADASPMNTDDHNFLATRRLPQAPGGGRSRRMREIEAGFAQADPLTTERLAGVDRVALLRRMVWIGQEERAERILDALPPAEREAARGWIKLDAAEPRAARARFRRAHDADPGLAAAVAGLVATGALEEGEADGLDAASRAIVRGRTLAAEGDEPALRALDAELARFRPGQLLFSTASRLRIAWRLAEGSPASTAEALAIADRVLRRERTPEHYLWRARAAAAHGDRDAAWAAIDIVTTRARPSNRALRGARDLAAELGARPADPGGPERRVRPGRGRVRAEAGATP